MKSLGMTASFGVDHKLDKVVATAKQLDLTLPEHQQTLFMWLRSPLVVGVFLAPPCGTASLARNIQLRDSRGRAIAGPRPLRSVASPEGLPNLTSAERARVSAANILYELVAKVVTLAVDRKLLVVVENPRSSLFWQTRFWKSIAHLVQYTAHQACAYGGDRPKWTVLAWNHEAFSSLNKTCPGISNLHEHKPWGLVHSSEGTHFSTSDETAYPKPLAMSIASTFARVLIAHGWSPPAEEFPLDFEPNLKTMRA